MERYRHRWTSPDLSKTSGVCAIKIRTLCAVNVDRNPVSDRNSSQSARKPKSFYNDAFRFCTGKKTPGGAGTHTGHARDTRAHTGTRITQTNLTTIQTQRHTVPVSLNRYCRDRWTFLLTVKLILGFLIRLKPLHAPVTVRVTGRSIMPRGSLHLGAIHTPGMKPP